MFQWDSRFLYLGDQKIEGRDTYVVAFAQLPSAARNKISMKGRSGITVHMLTHGIAWVDKGHPHIVQMQTDLLARRPEIGLDKQTRKVRFDEVRFPDVRATMAAPSCECIYQGQRFVDDPGFGGFRKISNIRHLGRGLSQRAPLYELSTVSSFRKNRDSTITAEYFSF